MVDFFIRRPIFATVSASLDALDRRDLRVGLPIAQYPQVVPPQVQVTTTYTGADALSVARTVTTPIEQQINGTKGMIYYNSDSTSNGVSNIVATFDVGYSQDMAAVDIQNRVQTAQAQLPPEVKQYGVSIKKTSTDMVCVVNLISPDGRFDANFLDNYGQIYVADVLKRIEGVSDANVLGRKYAMRIWIDPDRLANMKIAPTEVIQAIQQENVQAAAGKIGGRPVPTGQDFELPITLKGRLEKASEFEEIIVRRADDGSIVRIKDVARVELSSENFESAAYIDGKPAGGILIYQYADANALRIIHTIRQEMDQLKTSFPEGLDYTIVYNTTDYVDENIKEVQHTLVESFILVMIVVFVFLQGFRATIIPMLAIPVSLVATFAVMAAFGFSINSLTLCGLDPGDRPGRRRRDHRRRKRREVPASRSRSARGHPRRHGRDHHPHRDHHPGSGGGFRPRGLHAGHDREALQPVRDDDRFLVRLLGVQFTLVQPGDGSAVPSRQARRRRGSSSSAGSTPGCLDREFLRRRARMDGPSLVDDRRSLGGFAGAHWLDDRHSAQSLHSDRRSGLRDLRRPDSRRNQRREDRRRHSASRGTLPRPGRGQAHGRARRLERHHVDQPDQLRSGLRAAQ